MSARPSLVSAESTTVTELTGKVSLKNGGEEIAWDDIKKVAQELNKERMGRRFWMRVSAASGFAIVVVFALTLTAVIAGFELTRETKNNKKPHTETVVLETTNGDPISTSITEYSYDETYLCGVLQSDLDAPYPEKIGIDYDDDDGNVHELRMKVGMVERTVADGSDPTATVAAIYSTDGSAAIVLDESGDVYIHRGDAHFATEHVCDAGANRRLQEARRRLKKAPRVANALDHIPIMENEFDKAALDRRLARARGKVRIVLRARTFHGGRTAN